MHNQNNANYFSKIITPVPRELWGKISHADPEALPYQSANWQDCVCAVGNYKDASRLYITHDGRQMIMPLVRKRGLPNALISAASLPSGWGMGGLLSATPIQRADIAAIFDDLGKLPYLQVKIRPNPRRGDLWAAAKPKSTLASSRTTHILDLEGGFGYVWDKRFRGKTRTAVRKAQRLGVVVESDVTGRLVPVFYELLLHSFDRWAKKQNEPRWLTHLRGKQRDPMKKFQEIANQLGETCRIWVAWVGGKPAATILVLQGANANYSRGAMDLNVAARTGVNELLHKMAIEKACEGGCHYYNMGETGNSVSLARFKESFGAIPYSYAEYYLERFPITQIDTSLRKVVKKVIGFKD